MGVVMRMSDFFLDPPLVTTDLQGAFRLHYTCQRIASVLFGFSGKVNWTSILIVVFGFPAKGLPAQHCELN